MNLEQFINNNRNEFDSSEPKAGHIERFNHKLDSKFGKKPKTTLSFFMKIAAVFILAIMSALWISEKFSAEKNTINSISLSEISPEHAEVEYYFTLNIDRNLSELNSYLIDEDKLRSELYDNEFKQLDSLYQDLQKELAVNPNDDQIVDAMIVHYQTKLEIINTVLNQLKKVKSHKTKSHEKNEL